MKTKADSINLSALTRAPAFYHLSSKIFTMQLSNVIEKREPIHLFVLLYSRMVPINPTATMKREDIKQAYQRNALYRGHFLGSSLSASVILICMTIKAIIFDLGGVLLRTADFSQRDRLAHRLGMSRHALEELVFGGESGERAQRGEIAVQKHWENLQSQINCEPQDFKELLDEFFAQDELDEELIENVRWLHNTYKTALLTNAWDDLRQIIAEKWHFEDAFDTMIISAEVKLAKPDPRVFQLALDRLEIEADEAIFIDDMQRNVEAARAVGLHTIRFQSAIQMQFDLEKLLTNHRTSS